MTESKHVLYWEDDHIKIEGPPGQIESARETYRMAAKMRRLFEAVEPKAELEIQNQEELRLDTPSQPRRPAGDPR